MAAPVAALTAAVDGVVALPVGELCASELQALIVGVARQRDRLDGLLSTAEGQLAAATGGRVGTEHGDRSVVGWLAEATRTSCGAASAALRVAGRLRELPLIVQAVLDGVLTQEQATVLARLVTPIDTEQLQQCQPQLIEVAAGRDPVQLARYVAHLIATHSEPALEADEANAHAARYLQMRRGPDGSVRGRFRLAGGDGEALLTAIEALARKQGEPDARSAGQRRADALVELAELSLRHADLPEHGGQRPQLSYVLPADWAARQQQRADCPTCARCPTHRPPALADTVTASLPGQPGIPAEWAAASAAWTGPATRTRIETVLCNARISRILLNRVGQVRGLQALTDTVTAAQRRALAGRDSRCVARGCTRPPARCDAHHLLARADHGPTTLDNLVLLCRRHHVLWHLGLISLPDLHLSWHPDQRVTVGAGPPRE